MGYHRLWSHQAYRARFPLRILLATLGTAGYQGSIKWWVLRHRLHHRYTDTSEDPYNSKNGFWFSHIGWIFYKPVYKKLKWIDISDIMRDPIVRIQHRFYPFFALFVSFVIPTLVGYLWNDALGGFLYGGIVCRLLVWHGTFCINSFAHWLGDQKFSKETTARGGFLLALLTVGEGYHNFHHEFPKDYRNGIRFWDFDPTKWCIWVSAFFKQAYNLYRYDDNEIEKAALVLQEEEMHFKKSKLLWGPDPLPEMSMDTFEALVAANTGKKLIMLSGLVLDVTDFAAIHPGGEKLIMNCVGKDATNAFYGPLNNHTKSARLMLQTLSVAKLVDKDAMKKEE